MASKRVGAIFICAALAALAAACKSGPPVHHRHEYTLTPGLQHQPSLVRALLIPLDFTNPLPDQGLDRANDRIMELLAAHLESKGIRVERPDAKQFARRAETAMESVRKARRAGSPDVVSAEIQSEELIPALVATGEAPVDLVIDANLMTRTAMYQGTRTLVWDGVRRRETIYDVDMEDGGGVPAASILVAVYTRDGKRAFMGIGGLEPLFRIARSNVKYVPREDLFKDERNLREGICVAFYPYFGPEEFCKR